MASPDLTNAESVPQEPAQQVTYETLDEGRIARIWLNRPDAQNAQSRTLLVQLDEAFGRAEADDTVRVVILAGRGKNFSAGHDLGSEAALLERKPGPDQHPTFRSHGSTRSGIAERTYLQEWHYFFENTRRWRDLRKITVAQVQGNAISAGLMLIWACDLIVAADDAKFSDVVAVRMGMPGVEYYAHPWEFGARKAKELLPTGDSIDADEAYRLGMVSKVFPRADLEDKTVEFARRIAERPTMAALLVKDSVNAASDAMGFTEALRHAFHIHELGHAHWAAANDHHLRACRGGRHGDSLADSAATPGDQDCLIRQRELHRYPFEELKQVLVIPTTHVKGCHDATASERRACASPARPAAGPRDSGSRWQRPSARGPARECGTRAAAPR